MTLLLAERVFQYGFLGLHGLLGVLLGFVCWMVVAWAVWSIFNIIATKFSNPDTAWIVQIFRILLQVVIFLAFIQLTFNVF